MGKGKKAKKRHFSWWIYPSSWKISLRMSPHICHLSSTCSTKLSKRCKEASWTSDHRQTHSRWNTRFRASWQGDRYTRERPTAECTQRFTAARELWSSQAGKTSGAAGHRGECVLKKRNLKCRALREVTFSLLQLWKERKWKNKILSRKRKKYWKYWRDKLSTRSISANL